ncbi:MAG: hypothetical protein EOM67_13715 [Spirochaetia bacterium]|nr:hypothetical protein [Spirochaetia bacterium]
MKVIVTKKTSPDDLIKAMEYTSNRVITGDTNKRVKKMYAEQHSPSRTQIYMIELKDIPTFVSVHLSRHKIGVEHYIQSMRQDRQGVTVTADRNTLINHMMYLNAEALINLSYKRLCSNASKETREVIEKIALELRRQNDPLSDYLMPLCWYRNGLCSRKCVRGFALGDYKTYVDYLKDKNNV